MLVYTCVVDVVVVVVVVVDVVVVDVVDVVVVVWAVESGAAVAGTADLVQAGDSSLHLTSDTEHSNTRHLMR